MSGRTTGMRGSAIRLVSYMTPGFPASMFETIADTIGADLHLEQTTSGPQPGDDPFADNRADLGWICSTSYVRLALESKRPSIRLAGAAWVPDDPDSAGEPVYFGDIVVRPDSGIRSFDDLGGRRIGCNDAVSLSGHHALRWEIERRGADPSAFADLVFTGGHHSSIDQVCSGRLDAAVVDSVIRVARCRQDAATANLRIVERLGPWPVQPLVVRSGLDDAVVMSVVDTLIDGSRRLPLSSELERAALRGFVRVDARHYDKVRGAMAASTR